MQNRLVDRDWKKIEAKIESENENSGFLQNLIRKLQEIDAEPMFDFKQAIEKYAINHKISDLVKILLLVQNEGYIDEVSNVLDKVGSVIEDWMPCISN